MVNSHNVNRNVVLRWGRDNNLLSASLKMKSSLVFGSVGTGGLCDVVSTSITPLDSRSVLLSEYSDLLSVNNKSVFVCLEFSIESAYFVLDTAI